MNEKDIRQFKALAALALFIMTCGVGSFTDNMDALRATIKDTAGCKVK